MAQSYKYKIKCLLCCVLEMWIYYCIGLNTIKTEKKILKKRKKHLKILTIYKPEKGISVTNYDYIPSFFKSDWTRNTKC